MQTPKPSLLVQCVSLAFLGFAWELAYAGYVLCLTQRSILLAAALSAFIPYLAFAGSHFFVEANSLKDRLLLTGGTAFGYACGCVTVLSLF